MLIHYAFYDLSNSNQEVLAFIQAPAFFSMILGYGMRSKGDGCVTVRSTGTLDSVELMGLQLRNCILSISSSSLSSFARELTLIAMKSGKPHGVNCASMATI